MLSRVAGNAFWLARYLERAENTVRLTGAALTLAQDLPATPGEPRPWLMALTVGGDLLSYRQRFGTVTARAAKSFLLIDRANPSSLVSCLRSVRENARTARTLIDDAYWEAINGTWLESLNLSQEALSERGPDAILDWAGDRCRLIRGAADGLLRDALPHVLAAGQAIERVDYVLGLLLTELPDVLAAGTETTVPGSTGYRQWITLLRAAGAAEMYRRMYRDLGSVAHTIDLLALHPREPRSLTANLDQLEAALRGFTSGTRCFAIGLVQELREEVADGGASLADPKRWRGALSDWTARLHALAERITGDHFTIGAPPAEEPVPAEA